MPKTILLLEDPAATLRPIADLLHERGYNVETVTGHDDPMAAFTRVLPELVFLSLGADAAIEACEQVRNNPDGAIVPIVFVGDGTGPVTSPSQALARGADYYFPSDTDVNKILAKVQTYIGPGERKAAPVEKPTPKARPAPAAEAKPPPVPADRTSPSKPSNKKKSNVALPTFEWSSPHPGATAADADLSDASHEVMARISKREAEKKSKSRVEKSKEPAHGVALEPGSPDGGAVLEDGSDEATEREEQRRLAEEARRRVTKEREQREAERRAIEEETRRKEEEEERRRALEEDERQRAEERARRRAEQERERREAEEEMRRRAAEEEAQREAEEEEERRAREAAEEEAQREAEEEEEGRRAREAAEEDARRAAEEEKRRAREAAEEDAQRAAEQEERLARRRAEEEEARRLEAEEKTRRDLEAKLRREIEAEMRERMGSPRQDRDVEARRRKAPEPEEEEGPGDHYYEEEEEDDDDEVEKEKKPPPAPARHREPARRRAHVAASGLSVLRPEQGEFSHSWDMAALLYDIWAQQVTGRVDFANEGREKLVWFEGGCPVAASSSQPYDQMEEFLLREGKITRAQHREVRVKGLKGARRIGAFLTTEGYLRSHELFAVVRGHLEEIFYSLFEWEEGTFQYEANRADEADRVGLDAHPDGLIAEGIRRKYLMPFMVRRVGAPSSLLGPREGERPNLDALRLDPREREVVRLVDGTRNIEDLVFSTGIEAHRVYSVLAILLSLGYLDVLVRGIEGAPKAGGGDRDSIERNRIADKLEQVRQLDYFHVLGVPRTATPYEIQRAYERNMQEFGHRGYPEALVEELRDSFAEIESVLDDARYVLGQESLRDAYARNLG